jgi:ubiquinone/menaquinone biosynthesis C-methylase UbiE
MDLSRRIREHEWLDAPDADPVLLRKSFRYIRWINSLLRYTQATLSHLERFSVRWKPDQQIQILDLATGSADIPRAILRWADRRGFDVRITGIDLHPGALCEASNSFDRRLQLLRADALNLPFDDHSFDYAITNMFLHHLDDEQIVSVLRNMARVSKRGIIAADLVRNRRAYGWIVLFTSLANPMVKHDARVSVAQAFTKPEVLALRDRAGLGFASYHSHFGHRFVLAGEKAGV